LTWIKAPNPLEQPYCFYVMDRETSMIVCSCNVISDHEVRDAASTAQPAGRLNHVYRKLGRKPACGHCQRTIKEIVRETHGQRENA
jgi:bacterioferritin-associated ferredoxin